MISTYQALLFEDLVHQIDVPLPLSFALGLALLLVVVVAVATTVAATLAFVFAFLALAAFFTAVRVEILLLSNQLLVRVWVL